MRPPRSLVHERHEKHQRVWPRPVRLLLIFLFVSFVPFVDPLRAAEPFFKKGDVIAIVGGEDMVALSEYGYLELLLTRALPDYHLRFRNLAWEGDTVFEQRRDLNFPTWEEALEKIGATVVLCQFGQMESLGKGGRRKAEGGSEAENAEVAEFIAAYEKLLGRLSGGGKRRIVILAPGSFESAAAQANRDLYAQAIRTMPLQPGGLMDISPGQRPGLPTSRAARPEGAQESPAPAGADAITDGKPRVSPGANLRQPSGLKRRYPPDRDGVHLSVNGHVGLALGVRKMTGVSEVGIEGIGYSETDGGVHNRELEPLRQLIIAKNRLWFDYWRVQNWAFLAGDRTNQPSSRDHLDPTKRWFPEERARFLPLIEAREKEIDALAAKLSQP